MSNQRVLRFPEGFLWGTASSSYQCEGGNTNNQWYRWEQQRRITSGEQCGNAANWWQSAEADFDLAKQLDNNALRLSLEWSRVEPAEGQWNSVAIDRYRAMLTDLHRLDIKPIVTLHHFTDPLWFADRGGFANAANVRYFISYVTHVVHELRDLCDFWVTINEPNVYAYLGYLSGSYPPGETSLLRAFRVLRNLMQAHVEAFHAIRNLQPEAQIGYCPNYHLFDPASPGSPLDRGVANVQDTLFNWASFQICERGHFQLPLNLLLRPIAGAAGTRDYHGINYYTREMVHFDLTNPAEAFGRRFTRAGVILNDEGGEIYPEGLYRVLKAVFHRAKGNKPLYITENGFSDIIDDRRPRATLEHLAAVHRAISEGIPIHGYFYWSLIDNFEWNKGWTMRFGLIEVDPRAQQRTPRPSAGMFGEICRANGITESIVESYAPEAAESIFGTTNVMRR